MSDSPAAIIFNSSGTEMTAPQTVANSLSIAFAKSNITAYGQISITGGATAVALAATTTWTNGITIRNLDTVNSLYIGKDTSTTNTTGFLVKAGETWSVSGVWDPSTVFLYAPTTLSICYHGFGG